MCFITSKCKVCLMEHDSWYVSVNVSYGLIVIITVNYEVQHIVHSECLKCGISIT